MMGFVAYIDLRDYQLLPSLPLSCQRRWNRAGISSIRRLLNLDMGDNL